MKGRKLATHYPAWPQPCHLQPGIRVTVQGVAQNRGDSYMWPCPCLVTLGPAQGSVQTISGTSYPGARFSH